MAQNTRGGSQDRGREQGDTSKRGFASMDDEKQRAIAAEGGRAAHAQGTAHEFDSEEAREAGRKGGQSRGHSSDRDIEGDDRGGNRSQQAQGRERDSQGQFTSDDQSSDRESSGRGRGSDDDNRGGRNR